MSNFKPVVELDSSTNIPVIKGSTVADSTDLNSVFLKQQLTYEDPDTDNEIFAELRTLMMLPVDTNGGWKQYFTHRVRSSWGNADIIECCGKAPLVGLSQCELTSEAITLASAAKWCWSDVERAREAGEPIERDYSDAARRAIYELLEELIWKGRSDLRVLGVMNNPVIPRLNFGANLGGLNPFDIIARIACAFANVVRRNQGAGAPPDTLALPASIYAMFASTIVGQNLDRMLLDVIQQQSPFINRIDWISALETAGQNGEPVGFAYKNDPSYIKVRVPVDITANQLHYDGSDYCQQWYMRFGGVRINNPSSMFILENLGVAGKGLGTCLTTCQPSLCSST